MYIIYILYKLLIVKLTVIIIASMFSLVQFDGNGEYYILPSKRVKVVEEKNCIVKYTGGGMYNAHLIDSSAIGDNNKEDDEESDENSDSSDEENNHVTSAIIERTNTNMDYTDHTSTFDSRSSSASSSLNNSANLKCRNTSPFGKTKRTKWTNQERKAIIAYFGNLEKLSRLPSLEECRKATLKYKELNARTPQQVKTWIDNQRRAKDRKQAYTVRFVKR